MGSDPYRYEGRLTDLALDVLAGLVAAFVVAVALVASAVVAAGIALWGQLDGRRGR